MERLPSLLYLSCFFFIFLEVYPLLKGAKVSKENTYALHGKAVSIGVGDHQVVAFAMYNDGTIEFLSLSHGEILKRYTIASLNGSSIVSVSKDRDRLAFGNK
ncbi:MAG: hypothetical protein HS132_02420 [Planctomycetia bacterium]|nr:hypothetical protein [Planctomycetia bacterium]